MNTQTLNHEQFRSNIGNPRSWMRLAYMLIYALLLHVAGVVMWVLCTLQFLFSLITGKDNDNLRSLGGSTAVFFHQALDFLSYNTEQKPFPFAPWPENPHSTGNGGDDIAVKVEEVDDNSGEGTGTNL